MSFIANPKSVAAAEVAGNHAVDVDRLGRFPSEAIASLRQHGLLGLMVPRELGGHDATVGEIASICFRLAQGCSSTALIYAMHQIQVACAVAGAGDSAWHRDFLSRIASQQLLLASVTSEDGVGGNIRNSVCCLQVCGAEFSLTKIAPAVSYGNEADVLLITARRDDDAPASDQVLAVAERGDFDLRETGCWDTLGMRGTCSKAFVVGVKGITSQVMPKPFGELAEHTMLPVSHILWGAVWLGIATDALSRAHAHLRSRAHASRGVLPLGARRLERATSVLRSMQARLRAATQEFEAAPDARSLRFMTDINSLKTTLSESALDVVNDALRIGGISSYRNDTPESLGRHLRDLWSAPLMVNNDRIAENTANLLLAQRSPAIVI